ncbi:adenosylcobinamide-GDP ribazoletransferase [Paenibacillus alkaliterrae]|uniref:adenosylcobinamide-GDP ribazoletransferase n=1 Tax=Paenibacillus alkaliterrae TaxID=320909 RepID=UPI001F15C56F|nr:adenosylcobinamide-GDP ribazoletransferase [Paenibacillus alkaliterrae]MCF2937116.1 adenosylcobinamide-GDP ribazoletransferase [Paenibacillus alkaliterrae]
MARHNIKLHAQALAAAFQFLTRLPIPVQVPFEGPVLTRSVIYFPLAGAFIGISLTAGALLLNLAVPVWPSAVLLLVLWTALSGGLHMDGWMDTADGVLSHRSRERMLEIMKDSRVGAMGVLAAVLLLMLKASLLAELMSGSKSGIWLAALTICPVWSRAWMTAAIACWPSARQGEGIGVLFNGVKGINVFWALLVSSACTWCVLWIVGMSIAFILVLLPVILLVTVCCGGLLAAWLNRKLGGLTGDTYGAMNEAVEASLLLAAVIWLNVL